MLQAVRGSLQTGAVVSLTAGRRADFRSCMKRITASVLLRLLLHHLSWSEDSLCRETNKPYSLYAQFRARHGLQREKTGFWCGSLLHPGSAGNTYINNLLFFSSQHISAAGRGASTITLMDSPSCFKWIVRGWNVSAGHGTRSNKQIVLIEVISVDIKTHILPRILSSTMSAVSR